MYATEYYVLYGIACAALVAGLARILHWAGDVFLKDAFRERPDQAQAVARLLDIGFYLVSVGYVSTTYRSWVYFTRPVDVADVLATKLGILLLLLGFLHVFNILVLAIFRGRQGAGHAPIQREAQAGIWQ
jgi:hypothetical protein